MRDCEGVDIVENGFKPVSEEDCKKKCDGIFECDIAVYGGDGGKTGTSTDWWAKRCVPRTKFNGVCNSNQNWMKTYTFRGNRE